MFIFVRDGEGGKDEIYFLEQLALLGGGEEVGDVVG